MSAIASALFSSATSLVSRSAISTNYAVQTNERSLQIGVWKVERATHTSNGKKVSVWTADKAQLVAKGISYGPKRDAKLAKAVDTLKKEASLLGRLRHPCILEMAEPMEETRSSITFATEPVTASLRHALSASGSRSNDELELDEVEIQKGLSQLAKALQFLHDSAKLVHSNLTPEAVIINAKGDWKLSGFGLSTYLFGQDGVPARWEYPAHDHSLPSSIQRDYDYLAPEYLLDESSPAPANDLYSLGCILHSIHTKQGPPFSNRSSLENARTNIEEGLSRGLITSTWRKLPDEIQAALSQLVTRYPSSRLSATAFLSHAYFSSLLVSTLRFLERDSFAAQSTEAQTSFLKGLISVLPRFSDKVSRRKVLPSLLEEMRKHNLIPFLLPNILFIAKNMDTESFGNDVIPHLKPLFTIKEPPQAVIAMLDSLNLLADKCTPVMFREEVMPLIYHALESDSPVVLEKCLRVIPSLSEKLDYTTVKQTLLPKMMSVFAKTTLLSVKINMLICFHSLIPILDKYTLTEKLVPLLAKIKTKEPAVMIATLAVHEEIGKKCEIEAIATLILPQLWVMSMGPLLNLSQFEKFIKVIRILEQRVEQEHRARLQEIKRLEDQSAASAHANGAAAGQRAADLDFETLVTGGASKSLDLFADERTMTPPTPAMSPAPSTATHSRQSTTLGGNRMGARVITSPPAGSSAIDPVKSFSFAPSQPSMQSTTLNSIAPISSSNAQNGSSTKGFSMSSFAALEPSRPSSSSQYSGMSAGPTTAPASVSNNNKPNYNISMAPLVPKSTAPPSWQSSPMSPPLQPSYQKTPSQPVQNNAKSNSNSWQPLQPKKIDPPKPGNFGSTWDDFDPLK